MARTVEKILEDDDKKPALVTDEGADETLIEETGPTPEEAAADLRKQLEAANARADREAKAREDAENRASAASASAGNAVQAQITTQETAIEGKISLAKTNLDSIKAQLKQARQAGDSDAEIDLQDAMTNARYELNTAEWEKKNFAAWKEDQAKRTTKVEASSPYTAKEQAWISSHPEFGTSKKFARVAKSAAADALEEGLKQDSDKYFQYIEDALTEMKLLKPETADDEPLSGAGASTATAAAPIRTGDGGGAPVVNKNSKYPYVPKGFNIPADWVQASQDQGFDDPREYANDRLKIEAEERAKR